MQLRGCRRLSRVADAFPHQRENVHALGAKCKRRWHARSWCFPAWKETSSNEPGSGENGLTLRYIVACMRVRDVMLCEEMMLTSLQRCSSTDLSAESTTSSDQCFRKIKFFALATLRNAIALYTARYIRTIFTFDLNFIRYNYVWMNVITDACHIFISTLNIIIRYILEIYFI